jgi:hypothetical protein
MNVLLARDAIKTLLIGMKLSVRSFVAQVPNFITTLRVKGIHVHSVY